MITVSTVIPAYNAAPTIARSLDSALAQDFDGQEIIVVNDGSTDTTPEILQKYGSAIRIITQRNGGLSKARNAGVAASRGEYIALLDADDEWIVGKLSKLIEALRHKPDAPLAFSDFIPVDAEGHAGAPSNIGAAPSLHDLLSGGWAILPSAVVIRKSVLEQIGGFCEAFKGAGGGDDVYAWLCAREHGEFVYVPEPLVRYRQWPPGDLALKYEAGWHTFRRLVIEKYGRCATAGITNGGYVASLFIAGAMAHLRAGKRRMALRFIARAVRIRPGLLLDVSIMRRLIRRETLRPLFTTIRNSSA